MNVTTYKAFSAAMLPFYGFNIYFGLIHPVIAPLPMLADFINNVVMSQLALVAAAMLLKEQHKQ
jgi:hypothetical protein